MHRVSSAFTLAIVLSTGALQGCATTRQESFGSPEAATDAMIAALSPRNDDTLERIFGSEFEELVSSGDPIADRNAIDRFVSMYEQSHKLVADADGSQTLLIGPDHWPFPIPIIDDTGSWRFDTLAGLDEILNRRIGNNELDTITTCLAYVDAQLEYAMLDHDGDGHREYASKFVSDPGQHNGLFWPTSDGEAPSPFGELAAAASEAGYTAKRSDTPRPYQGYYYTILHAQGPSAPDGARDYMVGDQMIGGFALIARPATFGNSGVMTFIVNQDGIVYERNLGAKTELLAKSITAYDPDDSWTRINAVPYVGPE